jgi:outer membrane protein
MKKLQTLILSLIFSFGALMPLSAQTAVKVATVDMGRVYENYHRTADAQKRFQNAVEQAQAQAEKMMKEGSALVDEYRAMLEEVNNPALSEEARKRMEADAELKAQTIREKEQEAQQFQMNTQRALQQRQLNHRQLMQDEIRQVVSEIAKKKGVTLVLDGTTNLAQGMSSVVYSDPSYDISDEVLTELNKDQPKK